MYIKKITTYFVCIILFISTIPFMPTSARAETKVTVTDNNVNIRKGPGLTYESFTKAQKGNTFSLIEENGDWAKIKLTNGTMGWISKSFTTKSTPTATISYGTITADSLRVRQSPSTSANILGSLTRNQQVQIAATTSDWHKINYKNGYGYIHKDFVKVGNTSSNTNDNSAPTDSTEKKGTVNVNSLNLRKEPNTTSAIITKLIQKTEVNILSQSKEWYKITYKNYSGYVHSSYITLVTTSTTPPTSTLPFKSYQAKVTATSLNIRQTPTEKSGVIGSLKSGEIVTVLSETNNWCEIKVGTKTGYVAKWYLSKVNPSTEATPSYLSALYDSTNIREKASTSSKVLGSAKKGQTFKVVKKENDWYRIEYAPGKQGYIAGWLTTSTETSAPSLPNPNITQLLKNKKIVVDPGHGGTDSGTVGKYYTLEKNLTMNTANLLVKKLEQNGAKVVLTRSNDIYISLRNRVLVSHYEICDAFLSIHYDSSISTASGVSSFYYTGTKDYNLASSVLNKVVQNTKMSNRGVKIGDYQVLRDNKRPSTLLELGFLSNPFEELNIIANQYQEAATTGITQGVIDYLK